MKSRVVSKIKLRQLLLSLGFEEERGKHHVFFYFRHQGRIIVYTKISHSGSKDIGQPLLSEIRRQLHMSQDVWERFLKGELSREEYLSILWQRGLI